MNPENKRGPRIPVATYRLQFNHRFRFADAGKIISYLNDLGITDIYASPYFRAKEKSLHGYDIVDPTSLNPEVGDEKEYHGLIRELQRYGMGQVLDIVPNHMCIDSSYNEWWMDVLENGPGSAYAAFFDIDWDPVKKELRNKVLLPVLGDQYGKVLENKELQLTYDEDSFFVNYYEHRFPVNTRTYLYILRHRLHTLKNLLSSENHDYRELLCIIEELNRLPVYSDKNPGRAVERQRERETLKLRLRTLYRQSPQIRGFLEKNLRLFNGTAGKSKTFDLLDKLLNKQAYRLSYWRVAAEEINYRRFFDINNLGSIRMEDPAVFRETHKLIFRFIQEGRITGLRVDHPDGLYNPSEYFRDLQRGCFISRQAGIIKKPDTDTKNGPADETLERELSRQYDELCSSDKQFKPFYIVGEKILTKGERMPEEWPIFSTTGYVFLNSLNGIFIETAHGREFDQIYEKFIREEYRFQDVVYESKKLIMKISMSSEINTLGHYLNSLSEKDRQTRDFTLNSLTDVIKEVIAFFPVYRTYTYSYAVNERDRQYVEVAVSKAKRKNTAVNESIFDFLRNVLLLDFPQGFSDEAKQRWLDFVMRFQQITGPVMAKGLEDTSFYIYNRLVSLNEVGGMPERFGTPLDTFHGQNIERIKFWPNALIASATHDTKRSEDVRARINVLSEVPGEWKRRIMDWNRMNRKKKVVVNGRKAPERNEEYLFYQTIIGAWPLHASDNAEYREFVQRIKDYMIKALREAKQNTSWINPDPGYEEAVLVFIESVLTRTPGNSFMEDFEAFQKFIAHLGMFNSLSQAMLKITCPGVPDFYQGAELWDFSLVDPDNRRPVDYEKRKKMLSALIEREAETGTAKFARQLAEARKDGMIKLFFTRKALHFRRNNRELFERGEYIPLEVSGKRADNVCAFARRLGSSLSVTAVPRLLAEVIPETDSLPLGKKIWGDTRIICPLAGPGSRYRNVITGETAATEMHKGATVIYLAKIFEHAPGAILEHLD